MYTPRFVRRRSSLLWAVLCAPLFVSACGGGSSSGSSTPDLNSAPGDSALSSFLQTAHSYTLNGSYAGKSFQLQIALTPQGTTTFNGNANAVAFSKVVTVTMSGSPYASEDDTLYFTLNPYALLGSEGVSGTPYGVATSENIPATVTVGQSGTIGSGTYYHDSTEAVTDGATTITYSVSADSPTVLQFCTDQTVSGVTAQGTADGLGEGSETDCYTINAAGTATLVSVNLTTSKYNITFQ